MGISSIYTIKTQLKYICVCTVYMFVCTELIVEAGSPPELIFGMRDILGWPKKLEPWKFFPTIDGVMTQLSHF